MFTLAQVVLTHLVPPHNLTCPTTCDDNDDAASPSMRQQRRRLVLVLALPSPTSLCATTNTSPSCRHSTCNNDNGALSLSSPRPHPPRYTSPLTPRPRVDAPHATMAAPCSRSRLTLTHLAATMTTMVSCPRLKSPHATTTMRAPRPRPHLSLTHLVMRCQQRLALVHSHSHLFVTFSLFFSTTPPVRLRRQA